MQSPAEMQSGIRLSSRAGQAKSNLTLVPPLNGYDFLYGGIGRDILYGSQGNDYIDGESDEDFLDGGSGNDFLFGGLGNDFIDGGLNNDYLDGGDSNDTLTGGIGQDILLGGTGRDSFVFNEFGMSNRDIIKDFDVLSDTIILGNSLDNGLTRFINPGIKGLMFRGGNFSNNQLDSSKFLRVQVALALPSGTCQEFTLILQAVTSGTMIHHWLAVILLRM